MTLEGKLAKHLCLSFLTWGRRGGGELLVLGELGWASHRQSKGSPTFPIVGTHDVPRQGITLPTDTARKVICKRNKRRPFAGWRKNTTRCTFRSAIRNKSSRRKTSLMRAGFANEPKERGEKLEESLPNERPAALTLPRRQGTIFSPVAKVKRLRAGVVNRPLGWLSTSPGGAILSAKVSGDRPQVSLPST